MKSKLTKSIQFSILSGICTVSAISNAAENHINFDAKKVFTEVGTFTAPKSEYSYYYRDLDGDGTIEQLEINHWSGAFGTNGVGNLGFGYAGYNDALSYVTLKDINSDGLEDIVGIGSKGITSILNKGANFIGYDPVLTKFDGNLKTSADYLQIEDINNDGSDDIIFFYKSSIYLIEGNNGSFSTKWARVPGNFNTTKYKHIKVKDINYDGYPDIIGVNHKQIDVAINNTNKGFMPTQTWLASTKPNEKAPYSVQISDINQDGYADITTYYEGGLVKIAENVSGYKLKPYKQAASKFYAYGQQAIADVNNDGKADLLGMARSDNGKHVILTALNSGKGFQETKFYEAPIRNFADFNLTLVPYLLDSSKEE